MAASKEVIVKEEDLSCYICLELYEKPRTLPCLHSFCHICLVGYAKRGVDKISCPICRAKIQPENGLDGNVEQWVDSLPINFTLVSILSNTKETMSDLRNKCDQCLRDEMEESATVYCYECSEKLCEKCKEMHKKVKMLSRHKLCDIRNKQEDVAKLELLKSLTRCPEHLAEEVRYICKDHDQLCCNECAIVSHRRCERMISITKELGKKESSVETHSDRLEELTQYLDKLKGYEDQHQSNIAANKDELKEKLKDIKRRIDDAFSKLEQAICDEFEDKSCLILKKSGLHIDEITSLKSAVRLSKSKIETAKELGQPLHLFLMQRISRIETERHEDEIRRLCDKMSKEVVQAVEQTACNELEQKIATLLRIVTKCSTANIPACPGIMKYKSWLEAVKKNDDSTKIRNPDNSANAQVVIEDIESNTEQDYTECALQETYEEELEDESGDDNTDFDSNDKVAEHFIPTTVLTRREKKELKRKENRKQTKKL